MLQLHYIFSLIMITFSVAERDSSSRVYTISTSEMVLKNGKYGNIVMKSADSITITTNTVDKNKIDQPTEMLKSSFNKLKENNPSCHYITLAAFENWELIQYKLGINLINHDMIMKAFETSEAEGNEIDFVQFQIMLSYLGLTSVAIQFESSKYLQANGEMDNLKIETDMHNESEENEGVEEVDGEEDNVNYYYFNDETNKGFDEMEVTNKIINDFNAEETNQHQQPQYDEHDMNQRDNDEYADDVLIKKVQDSLNDREYNETKVMIHLNEYISATLNNVRNFPNSNINSKKDINNIIKASSSSSTISSSLSSSYAARVASGYDYITKALVPHNQKYFNTQAETSAGAKKTDVGAVIHHHYLRRSNN